MSRLDEHTRPPGAGRPPTTEDPWPDHVDSPRPPTHGWSTRRKLRLLRTVVVGGLVVAAGSYGVGHLTAPSTALSATRPAPTVSPASAPGAAATGNATAAGNGAATADAARTTPTGSGDDVADGDGIGPTPASVPTRGTGQFTVLRVPAPSSPSQTADTSQDTSTNQTPSIGARLVRYTVEIEGGLTESPADYARTVQQTLQDPRGWQQKDTVRFVDVSPEQAAAGGAVDLRILLATPATVDRLCAPLETRGKVSCFNGGRAVLNAMRYVGGATTYGTDVRTYRIYQINHEVGHGLGHGHQGCPEPGTPAPIMLQQTKYLLGCVANPYPAVP